MELQTMRTIRSVVSGGPNTMEIIYAVGASDDGKSIVAATVSKTGELPTKIKTRRGDTINVSDDSLEGLIIALQAIKSAIDQGTLKRGN